VQPASVRTTGLLEVPVEKVVDGSAATVVDGPPAAVVVGRAAAVVVGDAPVPVQAVRATRRHIAAQRVIGPRARLAKGLVLDRRWISSLSLSSSEVNDLCMSETGSSWTDFGCLGTSFSLIVVCEV
jgi:hypothetical protein